jgi:lipoate-protein ligase A
MNKQFQRLSLYYSAATNPYLNLAIENTLLSQVKSDEKILLFYRNEPCVVMGRFQNPWVECKVGKMQEDGVQLVRRQSGGGTVYHDLGNLNFSFIQGCRDHCKDQNNHILINALNCFGLDAMASGRSDLIIHQAEQTYKFSGSAFKQKKDRSIHHGTLLIDANLAKLNDYLHARNKKIQAKGIASVRSKVLNLKDLASDINNESLIDAIAASAKAYFSLECQRKDLSAFVDHPDTITYQQFLQDWQWRYGETPQFKLSLSLKSADIEITVAKGIIESFNVDSTDFHPGLEQELSEVLLKIEFKQEKLQEKFGPLLIEYPMYKEGIQEILSSLLDAVEV